MFKIGDFSRLCRVPASALRYYADIGLLQPAHIDKFTGYRYYTFDQLPRLNRILALKDLGLSLEQIHALLNDQLSADEMRGMLRLKQAEIQQRLDEEQSRLMRVAVRLKQIEKEGIMPVQEVVLKTIEAQHVISIREIIPLPDHVGVLLGEAFSGLMAAGVQVIGAPMAIFHDDEFKPVDMDVEIAFPLMPSVTQTVLLGDGRQLVVHDLPAIPTAACIIHSGSYDGLDETYSALSQWVAANHYRLAGNIREVYLTAPGDPSGPITEIQYPVEKA